MGTYNLEPIHILLMILGTIIIIFIYFFFKGCKYTTDTPEYLDPEHINDVYIFRDFHGYDIVNENNKTRFFTFREAKEFAKENPSYHVKLNDFDAEWEIAETYFNI